MISLDSYLCQCPPGYQGTFCEIFVDPCAGNLCASGSSCQSIPNTLQYICICPLNYRGVYCDQKVPACESNPCVNGKKN